jgi:hypothetical protein
VAIREEAERFIRKEESFSQPGNHPGGNNNDQESANAPPIQPAWKQVRNRLTADSALSLKD